LEFFLENLLAPGGGREAVLGPDIGAELGAGGWGPGWGPGKHTCHIVHSGSGIKYHEIIFLLLDI